MTKSAATKRPVSKPVTVVPDLNTALLNLLNNRTITGRASGKIFD